MYFKALKILILLGFLKKKKELILKQIRKYFTGKKNLGWKMMLRFFA